MVNTNKNAQEHYHLSNVLLSANATHIEWAAKELEQGNLIGMPTETVYGLAADAQNADALAKLFACKGRPADHPVIVHVDQACDLSYWVANLSPIAQALIDAFWPGPLTLILPRAAHVLDWVTGGQKTIGLRCPSHPVAQALIQAFALVKNNKNVGLAAPSANRFGKVSPTRAQHVIDEFKDEVKVIDGGASEIGIESTIVDLSRNQAIVLRPGKIREEEIAAVIHQYQLKNDQTNWLQSKKLVCPTGKNHQLTINRLNAPADQTAEVNYNIDAPRVAGTLAAHYAPSTPLKILNASAICLAVQSILEADQLISEKESINRFSIAPKPNSKIIIVASKLAIGVLNQIHLPLQITVIEAPNTVDNYAYQLYALLRRLDQLKADQVWIEKLPDTSYWKAVNDRLQRAAASF